MIAELLARPPVSTTTDTRWLRGYHFSHVPEVECDATQYVQTSLGRAVEVDGVTIDVLAHDVRDAFGCDVPPEQAERRFWRVAVVRLDGLAVMVVRNDGREGDDSADRFVIDADLYVDLIERLLTSPEWSIARPDEGRIVSSHFAADDLGDESDLETFAGRPVGAALTGADDGT